MEVVRFALILLSLTACGESVRVRLWSNHPDRAATRTAALEDYVAWVLNGEAGGFSSPEALKAMAVVARTYARVNRGRHAKEGFDFCDTTHCQDLRIADSGRRMAEAAAATEGIVLWWQGRPAAVYFHKHCGGRSASAQEVWPGAGRPYLRVAADSFCLNAGRAPWSARVDLREMGLSRIAVAQRSSSGRAALMHTDRGSLDAESFVLSVGRRLGWHLLKSRFFEVRTDGANAIFEGFGEGHGVGLCQTGAEQRGMAGHSWKEILQHYFPGTRAGEAARDLRWQSYSGERVTLFSVGGGDALREAERAFADAIHLTGLGPREARPRVYVYPTVAAMRDATGEPGFVAAATRGSAIRIQPAGLLRSRDALLAALRHEFVHFLLQNEAKTRLPRWFEEGFALWLEDRGAPAAALDPRTEDRLMAPASEGELRAACANARGRVAGLIKEHGLRAVLSWVSSGLPGEIAQSGVVR